MTADGIGAALMDVSLVFSDQQIGNLDIQVDSNGDSLEAGCIGFSMSDPESVVVNKLEIQSEKVDDYGHCALTSQVLSSAPVNS